MKVLFSCRWCLAVVPMLALAGCSPESGRAGGYREHFEKASGYKGPLSEFNFSYSRPVDTVTIGWVKVGRSGLVFDGGGMPDVPVSGKPAEAFQVYRGRVICPPENHRYLNWSSLYDGGRIRMSFDLDDEFLWFIDEKL